VKPSTSASGSQPSGNNKKDKIQRPPSSTQINKVVAHPRTVKSSLKNKSCVVEPKGTASAQHSKLNANSKFICVKCNGCLLKLKFENDHLCSAYAMGKSKKKPHKPKSEDNNQEKLYLLHMDLCGLIRVASVNGKTYILVIVDDYSRFTQVGISHETSVACSSQQNGVIERHNRTLIEVASTMLIYAKALLFLWTEAVATACYTRNRSMIRLHHRKTSYRLLHNKPPDLSFLHVFGVLCYLTNDIKNLASYNRKLTLTLVISNEVEEYNHELDIAHMNNDQFYGIKGLPKTPTFCDDPLHESLHEDSTSQGSSSNMRQTHTSFESLSRWTEDHPIANVISDPSRSVSTRKQLQTNAMWCFFDSFLTTVEPKNFKQAMTKSSGIDAMQEEIYEFERCSGSDTPYTESRERFITDVNDGANVFFLRLQISQSPRENSKIDEDLQGKPVDATLYNGMIGSLMYLTSSRPDHTYAAYVPGRNRVNTSTVKNTKLLSGIEDSPYGPSDIMHNPSQLLKVRQTLFQNSQRFTHFYRLSYFELVDIEKVKDSILQARNPVKEILLKLDLPDHRILKDGGKGELHGVSLNNKVESKGHWDGSEFQDTTNGGENKRMRKNMISNEFVVKLLLDYEEKNGEKIVKKELLVSLNGELYFVKFIINPEQDDVEPGVVFGRSFLKLTKGIVDFGNEKLMKKEAIEEVIRGYKTIREKNDPGVFVLLIRIEGKFDIHALADTGSNINVLPYRIYAKLGRDKVKPMLKKITMLDHSKAEPMGILKDVLCQVVRNKQEESDDDEKEYIMKRDKNGKPIYGPEFLKYLNCDDPMDRALAL
nr:hypothetical protein [Tanacetum cinerariifolium]